MINVLSLFDGMSCGRIALERIGQPVGMYARSEIDKHALLVARANYPKSYDLGDVTKWREWPIDWSTIDLIMGGSPCQGFSAAGKQGGTRAKLHGQEMIVDTREKYVTAKQAGAEFLSQSYLFWEFVLIVYHIRTHNPKVKILLENVKMSRPNLDMITAAMGCGDPVFINSALVSAQNRQRYYWCNWEVGQPENRGIVLADILESEKDWAACVVGTSANRDIRSTSSKAGCLTANYYKGGYGRGKTVYSDTCIRRNKVKP